VYHKSHAISCTALYYSDQPGVETV